MIQHVIGDATDPIGNEPLKLLLHGCNNINKWGRGFVLAVSAKWPRAEMAYHRWFATDHPKLGDVLAVDVPGVSIYNMITQDGIRSAENPTPFRYDAFRKCLQLVKEDIEFLNRPNRPVSVHMPRIGAGLAGGDWNRIQTIIEEELGDVNVPIYIYTKP